MTKHLRPPIPLAKGTDLRLTVVGSSGSMSGPASPASCYLLQADGVDPETGRKRTWSIVMDIGPGSFGALWQYVEPRQVDALLVSHGHADHMADVISFHVFLKWHPDGPNSDLPVYGPKEVRKRVRQIDGYDQERSTEESFNFVPVTEGDQFSVGPMTIQTHAALHPVEAYGFRVVGPSDVNSGEDSVFGYTGDTDLAPSMVELAWDATLLLAEAGFTKDVEVRGVHMTGERAGQLAKEADVKELVLTHVQPWTDPEVVFAEARSQFTGLIDLAAPGGIWVF